MTQLYDDALAPAGLRVTQFSLLRTLQQKGGMPISSLAAATLLDRTALSRTLEPLVEHGWVRIETGRDARVREVGLTAAGAAAIHAAEPHWQRAQRQVAARLGDARLARLIDVLREIESLHPSPAARAG